jgi:hypothetical protein
MFGHDQPVCGKPAERNAPEIPDVDRSQRQSLDHPLILRISVTIFVCPECMRDPFDGVDNGTSKVVSRVHLPFLSRIRSEVAKNSQEAAVPNFVMRSEIASINDRIPESLVVVVHADLGTKTPTLTLRCPCLHFIETAHIIADRAVTVLGGNSQHSLLSHLGNNERLSDEKRAVTADLELLRIICVSFA